MSKDEQLVLVNAALRRCPEDSDGPLRRALKRKREDLLQELIPDTRNIRYSFRSPV